MSQFVISAAALEANLSLARRWAPEAAKLRAMVKANAYGHGLEEVLEIFADHSDELGVASVEEGLQVRSLSSREIPVYVMSGDKDWGNRSYLDAVLRANLIPVISSLDELLLLQDRLGSESSMKVEIKLDTGMGRLGIQEGELAELLTILETHHQLLVIGWLTHFSASDERALDSMQEQDRRFQRMLGQLTGPLAGQVSTHSCNSGALMQRGLGHQAVGEQTGTVRPGVMLYGAGPSRFLQDSSAGKLLKPVGLWKTRVIDVRSLAPGEAVGYGSTWRVEGERSARVAVLPVGYADGFRRSLGGRAQILIRGGLHPVVGRVSMDMISVLVNDRIGVGDEAVLLGSQEGELGSHTISVWDWAHLCETIPYEIWAGLGSRVRRVLDSG